MAFSGGFYEDVRPAVQSDASARHDSSSDEDDDEVRQAPSPRNVARTNQESAVSYRSLDELRVDMPMPLTSLLGIGAHKELQRMRATRGYKNTFTDGPPKPSTPLLAVPQVASGSLSRSPSSISGLRASPKAMSTQDAAMLSVPSGRQAPLMASSVAAPIDVGAPTHVDDQERRSTSLGQPSSHLAPLVAAHTAAGEAVRSASVAMASQQAQIDTLKRDLEALTASLSTLQSTHHTAVDRHNAIQAQLAVQRRATHAGAQGADRLTHGAIVRLANSGKTADTTSDAARHEFGAERSELEHVVSVSMPTIRPLMAFASSFTSWESCATTANNVERQLRSNAAAVCDVCPALKFIEAQHRLDISAKSKAEAEPCLLETLLPDRMCTNFACPYYHENAHKLQWKSATRLLHATATRAVSPEIDIVIRRAASDLATHVQDCENFDEAVAGAARERVATLLRYIGTRVAHKGWLNIDPIKAMDGAASPPNPWLLATTIGDNMATAAKRLYANENGGPMALHLVPRFVDAARQGEFKRALTAAIETLTAPTAAPETAGDRRLWFLALMAARHSRDGSFGDVALLASRALPTTPAIMFAAIESAMATVLSAPDARRKDAMVALLDRVYTMEECLSNVVLAATVEATADGIRPDATDVELVSTPETLAVLNAQRQLAGVLAYVAVGFATLDKQVQSSVDGLLMQKFLKPYLKPTVLQPVAVCNLTLMCIEQLLTGAINPYYPIGMVPESLMALHLNVTVHNVPEPRRGRAQRLAEHMLEWVLPALAALRLAGPRAQASLLGRTLSRIESVTRSVIWTLQNMGADTGAKLFNVKLPSSAMAEACMGQIARLCLSKDRRLPRIAKQAAITLAYDCITCLRVYGLMRRQNQPLAAQVFAKAVVDANATERGGLTSAESLAEALLSGRDSGEWAMPADEGIALSILTANALCAVDAEFTATRLLTTRLEQLRRPEATGVCCALLRETCALESGSSGSVTQVMAEIQRRLNSASSADAVWQRDVMDRGNIFVGLAHVEAADMWTRPLQLLHPTLWTQTAVHAVQSAVLECAVAAHCVHPCMYPMLSHMQKTAYPQHHSVQDPAWLHMARFPATTATTMPTTVPTTTAMMSP